VTAAARELGPLRAALLAGSGARGDADFYSDVDLLLYVDELPPDDRLAKLQEALGGVDLRPIAPPQLVQFEVGGVAVQVGYTTVAELEEELDKLLVRLEDVHGPQQKLLSGLLEGTALYGEELLAAWRERVSDYPEPLRRAAVEHHWQFFPLWWYAEPLAARDAELWRVDMLLDAAFNLLGVLAGLNRVYFARFQLKNLRALVAKFEHAPPDLATRLESLFRLPPPVAADELGALVEETRAFVSRELPDLELPLGRPPGTRAEPWRI
jgi:predicted nucleotidyltransferase